MFKQFNAESGKPSAGVSPKGTSSAGLYSVPSPADAVRHELVYDLRVDEERSDRFYADVAAFSARVVAEIESRASGALDGYSRYVIDVLMETPCSRAEYALELLTVGMVFRLYGEASAGTPGWVIDLARELYSVRRRDSWKKSVADFVRAALFQLLMNGKLLRVEPEAPSPGAEPQNRLSELPRLLEWLQATGEFEQEWKRLDNWRCYWAEMPAREAESNLAGALALFDWFTREAALALGKYTAGVMHFLKHSYALRVWREDRIFCARLPVEYHLGMVAAEVMNNGLRDGFDRKPRKVVLVPTCMRGARRETCKAIIRGLDMTCTGCDPACAVNRITQRMRREGVQVYMVPHASGFSRWLARWQDDPKVGVAAVACLMNILPGGYEMRARGISSQCVPLDYPGCAKHWAEEAIPTGVNEERLMRIVTSSK